MAEHNAPGELTEKRELLEASSLLTQFEPADLDLLAGASTVVNYPPDADIIVEGNRGEALYFILEGTVQVLRGPRGREKVLSRIVGGTSLVSATEGTHFGEMSLVDLAPYSATVRSEGPARVVVLPLAVLIDLFERKPALQAVFFLDIARILSRRLRHMNEVML